MKGHLKYLVIIIFFSLLGMKALFHPGLFTAHDIWHQVARLYHYWQAIKDGQYPPYWIGALANGYGYPLFFFSYHLPWITAIPLLTAGVDIPTILKALLVGSYLISGITMYHFATDLFEDRWAGLLSALVYLWAPYRFLTTLVSAGMGICFVFVFAPLIFWGIYKIAKAEKQVLGIILTSLGISGAILSHLPSTLTFLPILVLFIASLSPSFRTLKKIAVAFLLGIALSSFYLIPSIYYRQFTQFAGDFRNLYKTSFVNLSQLIYSKWGYGVVKNAKDGAISFQIGIAQWVAVIGGLLLLMSKKVKSKKILGLGLFLSFGLSVLFMLDISRPIWDFGARFIPIDFPTRFLLPSVFAGSVLSGFLLTSLKKSLRILTFIALFLIALYTNRNHLKVNMYTYYPVSLYVDSEITTSSYNEYLPAAADPKLLSTKKDAIIEPKDILASNFVQKTNVVSFNTNSKEDMEATINYFYFPGQTLYLDKREVNYQTDNQGRITFNLPYGTHLIEVKFQETKLIKAAKLISLLGFLTLVYLVFSHYNKRPKNKTASKFATQ